MAAIRPLTPPSTQAPAPVPGSAGVVRLSANENPYGPTPAAFDAMREAFDLAWRYPDEAADALVSDIARHQDVPEDHVLLGSGSSEILTKPTPTTPTATTTSRSSLRSRSTPIWSSPAPSRRSTAWPACAAATRWRSPTRSPACTGTRPGDTLNILALVAARAGLADEGYTRRSRGLNRETRSHVASALDSLGCPVIPAQTNFVMADLGRETDPVIAALAERGVRVGRRFPTMPEHLRVTLGTREQMETFLRAFRTVIG